ncbi:MAG: AI-2E family transporter [Burkholderiales bacterium]|nr:AI-2E family transporter [Burkholderiales bacterium]
MSPSTTQRKFFLLLQVLVTVAMLAILLPYYGAIFWAGILALLFRPLNRRLLVRMPKRRNLASLITLLVILLLVILPVGLVSSALIREAAAFYDRVQSGEFDFVGYFERIVSILPHWLRVRLEDLGLFTLADVQQRVAASASRIGQYLAPQALNLGQTTLYLMVSFGIMLYLLFFLLRDGATLSAQVRRAIPLDDASKHFLLGKFATVIRATVKGNVAVAVVQGLLGGLIFWALDIQGPLLWGVMMAVLSLLPAVGASLIWGPVAIYFLATGQVPQGVILIAFGVLVIGLVDNALRPLLVGKDTKMPDWVVLISTVGGLSLVGINGFVIGPLVAAMFIATWDLFAEMIQARSAAEPGGKELCVEAAPGAPADMTVADGGGEAAVAPSPLDSGAWPAKTS